MARKPKRASRQGPSPSRTTFNQLDLPVVIRVSDDVQALIPHIEVARAIGFVKAKARQLTAILWRQEITNSRGRTTRRRNTLPDRTYYWSMPGSDISMIELKTNPREQSWHARIIGGGERFGQFIWIPMDDVATFQKQQILVKSAGFEGPYEVFVEPDLSAGNIDWKGPTRTEDVDGDPLVDPTQVTDVITWQGPENRVMQFVRPAPISPTTWKDGAPYAKAPINDKVCGAAIQGVFGSGEAPDTGRKDVMICEEAATFSKTGGVQDIGVLNFNVYIRPEGALIEGSLTDPTPWHPDDNPNGWKLIATLGTFDDIAAERWTRTRTWYFNRDGTEASALLPSNIEGDVVGGTGAPTVRRCFQFCDEDSGTEVFDFPMHLRLATITIDAFAETASISFEGREGVFDQTDVGTVSRSASGGFSNFCFGAPVGSFSTSRSETASRTHSGSPRRVAVDYKGNTRVFGILDLIDGAGFSGTNSTSETNVGNNPAFGQLPPHPFACPGSQGCPNAFTVTLNGNSQSSFKFGYTLQAGASSINLWHTESTSSASASTSGICGVVTDSGSVTITEVENTRRAVGILWLDLRVDLIIYSEGSHLIQSSEGTGLHSGNTSIDLYTMNVDNPATLISERRAKIHAQQNGNVLAEYSEGGLQRNGGIDRVSFGRTRSQGTTTLTSTPCKIGLENCTINWSNTTVAVSDQDSPNPKGFASFGLVPVTTELRPLSLESFNDRDDNLQVAAFAETNYNRRGTAATDTAGNTAFSFQTFEGLEVSQIGAPDFTYPGPKELTFIHGDDLIDVMNQVEYFDPGPDDELGTEDDILQPPVDEDTGRAKVLSWTDQLPLFTGTGTIKIL